MVYLPLWIIWIRQLGWWNSQHMGKKHVPNHQPFWSFHPHFLLVELLFFDGTLSNVVPIISTFLGRVLGTFKPPVMWGFNMKDRGLANYPSKTIFKQPLGSLKNEGYIPLNSMVHHIFSHYTSPFWRIAHFQAHQKLFYIGEIHDFSWLSHVKSI